MARDARLRFWITVSGGPAEDNKYYILSANLPLEGRSPAETRRLLEEWVRGRRIFAAGGSYEAYLQATEALRRDPAVRYLAGDLASAADAYQAEQRAYLARKEAYPLDERTMSIIRVPGLAGMLQAIAIDALALFGENDTNADWRGGRTLYESTIGRNPKATLEVRTFPGCNHAINRSKTGSIREVEATPLEAGPKCEGYYETQIDWLRRRVVRP